MNSRSATATPARSAIATPSPVDRGGFVVTAKHCPAPPVAMTVCVARRTRSVPVGIEHDHAGRAAVLDEEVGGEPTLVDLGTRLLHRDRQRPFDLGPGRVAARVDDPRHRVASLARERECSVDDVEVARRAP